MMKKRNLELEEEMLFLEDSGFQYYGKPFDFIYYMIHFSTFSKMQDFMRLNIKETDPEALVECFIYTGRDTYLIEEDHPNLHSVASLEDLREHAFQERNLLYLVGTKRDVINELVGDILKEDYGIPRWKQTEMHTSELTYLINQHILRDFCERITKKLEIANII